MCVRPGGLTLVAVLALLPAAPQPALVAQQPPRGSAPASQPGSLFGTVVALDGSPVSGAHVTVTSPALSQARTAATAADGTFAFPDIPAGEYVVRAARPGFVMVPAAPAGVRVRLRAGEAVRGVDLGLAPEGAITGRLDDEQGTPLAGGEVEALSLRVSGPGQAPIPSATGRTDTTGRFRLAPLPPGQYVIAAREPAPKQARAASQTTGIRYPRTFYPVSHRLADALPVTVAPGDATPDIEFRVRRVAPATLSGVMRAADTRPLVTGAVVLVPRDGSILDAVAGEDVDISPDGRFTFRNVPPGEYQLRARAALDARETTLFGSFAVTVSAGRDVENLVVPLAPGAVLQGRVEWAEGEHGGVLRGLRVRAPFVDGTSFGDPLTGDVLADGTFRLRGVMSGLHHLTVEGLPDGARVAALAVRGRDMLLQPLELHEAEHIPNVRIVLSAALPELTGMVRDADGRPSRDTLVLILPRDAVSWSTADRRFAFTRTDMQGRYVIGGVPPGTYAAAAVAGADELAVWRPLALGRLLPRAAAITIRAGRNTVDLPAVPGADLLTPAAAR